jgi:uncharacterized repeat protein (TIGR03943 family)
MNALNRLLGRWWRLLLCLAWIWALGGILQNERYLAFLRPEFGYVIGLGVFVLLGFLVTGIGDARQPGFDIPCALRASILCLPLAHLMNAQGVSLDSYAFRNRFLGPPSVGMTAPQPSRPGEPLPTEPPFSDRDATIGSEEPSDPPSSAATEDGAEKIPEPIPVTIVDLYYSPGIYEGKRVRLVGMLQKNDARVKELLGKDMLVVFRFVINCCAADASPAAVLVDGDTSPDISDDTWVEVEGVFRIQQVEEQRAPMIDHATLKAITPPRHPYLLP